MSRAATTHRQRRWLDRVNLPVHLKRVNNRLILEDLLALDDDVTVC